MNPPTQPTDDSDDDSMPEPAEPRICSRCISDTFLADLIDQKGVDGRCSYCANESKTFSVEELADMIEDAFEDHYERTPTEPSGYEAAMQNDSECNYEWNRHGEPVVWAIAQAAGIEHDAASDIFAILERRHCDLEADRMGEESSFGAGSYYAEKNPGCHEFSQKWDQFEAGIKTEARFFSRTALATLEEIFADLPSLMTEEGGSVIVTCGPGQKMESLYRARVFAGEDEKLEGAIKFPWKDLGSPPMSAASAGRMNARGISVFYGSIEAATALAEVRPPVGSKVAVAKFIIDRPLQLLDVEALTCIFTYGSIFDPAYLRRVQRANFLKILSKRISLPVMPNAEAFEYLATQAIADFLATEAKLDGIIFPSVQVADGSSNVTLFHHASRVAEIEFPKGTKLDARLERYDSDGASPDYFVWEQVPASPTPTPPSVSYPPGTTPFSLDGEPFDARPVSLKIDLNSTVIHHIKAVKFTSQEHKVGRHRLTKVDPPPF